MSDDHSHKHDPNSIELPAPTSWPVLLAFAITLLFAGLITNPVVSVVGFVLVIYAATGLWMDVFPGPKHVFVPAKPESEQASPIKTSGRSVQSLHLGEHGHRVRIPVEIHSYSSGVYGGLAGGFVMAVLAVLYGIVREGSIWFPINLLAASAVPTLAEADLEVLRQFNAAGLIVAVIVHLTFSVLVGLLYAVLLPMLPRRFEWFWGGIMTPLLWTGLIHATMGMINPTLAIYIDWTWFVICQVAFGMVGGYVVFKSARIETMQTWPLALKMGVEAPMKGGSGFINDSDKKGPA